MTKTRVRAARLNHAMLMQTWKNDEAFGRPLKPDVVEKTTWFVVAGLAPRQRGHWLRRRGPTAAKIIRRCKTPRTSRRTLHLRKLADPRR